MRPHIIILLILLFSSVVYADRYEYDAQVNQYIPEGDSAGIRDTIFIPEHLIISDINFFIGVGRSYETWGEAIIIDAFSPSRASVRLNDTGPDILLSFNIWYDTQRIEDGPGQLEDYAGTDAYGAWEVHCFDPFQSQSMTWYNWRIELITSTDAAEEKALFPTEYAISGAYPNPFNSSMAIEYSIPEISQVKLDVYDICGRRVRALINSEQAAGYYRAVWDGTDNSGAKMSSGVYLFRLSAGERQVAVTRATMLK